MEFENFNEEIENLISNEDYIRIICSKISTMSPREEKIICEKLLDFARINNLENIYPWILINLGWANLNLGNSKIAQKMHLKAYEIFKKTNNIEGLLSVINGLVVDYYSMEYFDKAIEYGLDGVDLATKYKNYERLSAIIGNIAAIYVEIEEYEKAKILLNQLEKLPYISNRDNEISNYINIAVIECRTNNIDKALEYIEKAYEISKKYEPNLLPRVLKKMGMIYGKKGLYDLAESKFIESTNIARERQCKRYANDILSYWGELDLIRGKYKDALTKLKSAEREVEYLGLKLILNRIYILTSKAYEGVEDYKQAHCYLKKYSELEKEINKIKNCANMKNLDRKKEEQEVYNYKLLYNQTEALYGVGQRITSNLDKENVFNIIVKEIEMLISCDAVEIAVYQTEDTYEYQLAMRNGKRLDLEKQEIPRDSFMGYCIYNSCEIIIHDVHKEYKQYIDNIGEYIEVIKENKNINESNNSQSLMFIPIIINRKVIGAISIQSCKKNAYDLKDLTTLKILSTYVGIALENSRLYKEIQHNANHDELTKVLNRREALNKSKELLKEAKLYESIYVLMIDIDDFKKINDTYGHQEGDNVLTKVASTIKSSLRENDIVGRYGGEEFIVVVKIDGEGYNLKVAERIRRNVENIEFESDTGEAIKLTVSIGMSKVSDSKCLLEDIIGLSDKALYKAKNNGKNMVVVYEESIIEEII